MYMCSKQVDMYMINIIACYRILLVHVCLPFSYKSNISDCIYQYACTQALNYGKYTPASDIWSYGIMLWEAFSCGSPPYPGMNNQDARLEVRCS